MTTAEALERWDSNQRGLLSSALSGIGVAASQVTAPFRGYGMERVPHLRSAYANAYKRFVPQRIGRISLGDVSLTADWSDTSIVPSLLFMRRYEPTYSRHLDKLVDPGMTVVDVGSHIGYYAVRYSRMVGRSGAVVAFEARSDMSDMLRRNISDNTGGASVKVIQAAASNYCGSGTLVHDIGNGGGASLAPRAVMNPGTAERVRVTTIDLEPCSRNLERIDILKIDVQGLELKVIEGAIQHIHRDWPTIGFECNPFQIEAAGDSAETGMQTLAEWGYDLFMADERRGQMLQIDHQHLIDRCITEKPDGTGYANVIAVHPEGRRIAAR